LRHQQPGPSYEVPSNPDLSQTYSPQPGSVNGGYSPHASNMQLPAAAVQAPTSSYTPAGYVTPSMWQDVVASSFGDGMKRRWDYGGSQQSSAAMGMAKRQQR